MARQNIGYGSAANDGTGDALRDAFAKANDNFIELYAASPATHRGALVTKSADQTAANYVGGVAVSWNSEAYDTDSIHDNSTNPSRLTVPSGVAYVKLEGAVRVEAGTATDYLALYISKNGSIAYTGCAQIKAYQDSAFQALNVASPPLAVSPGDYFELLVEVEADTSVTLKAGPSWFAMKVLG